MTAGRSGGNGGTEVVELAFERWAELSAKLMFRDAEEQYEILAQNDLDLARWNRCDQHWLLTLARSIASGNDAQPLAYGRICAEEMAARRARGEKPDGSALDATAAVLLNLGPAIPFDAATSPSPRPVSAPLAPSLDTGFTGEVRAIPDEPLPFPKRR